jgi:Alr-MurF fusion protein
MINLYDILDAADGQLFGEPSAQIFSGFSFDPLTSRPGDMFVALKTERGDGHHFMEEAVRAGAVGLMCTLPPSFDTEGVTVVIMRDVEAALMLWARYILNKYGTTVVAVAGSVGKSTTCHAISKVLSLRYQVYNGMSDLGRKFSVPLALGGLESHHQLAVLEFESHDIGQMAEILEAAPATVGVVMACENQDLRSNELMEIQTLLNSLPADGGLAVVNYDEGVLRDMAAKIPAPYLTVSVDRGGTSFGADLTAFQIVSGLDKTGFDLRYGTERRVGRWVPLLGAHQLYAALAAVTVGLAFDVPLDAALNALTELEPLPGRMRPLPGINGALVVDDSYSATSQSVIAALDWLAAVLPRPSMRETQYGFLSPRGQVYVALGEIDGLSRNTPELVEKLASVAHTLVTEGEAAAVLARASLETGFLASQVHMTYSPQDAAQSIKAILTPKDVVLITGNKRARMERTAAELLLDKAQASLLPRQSKSAAWVEQPDEPTWIEIDTDAIAHNVSFLKTLMGADVKMMAMVEGDAYGHGALAVSTTALLNGADYLGVAALAEAVFLRESGIAAPILVLGYTPAHHAAQAVRFDTTLTLYDQGIARSLNRAAASTGKKVRVHVRLDVGMHGLGVPVDETAAFFRSLIRLESLEIEGVYTVMDASDIHQAEIQFGKFQEAVKLLKAGDFKFEMIHAAGSAIALELPNARLNMVRLGSSLYGLRPERPLPEGLKPVLSWRTTVAQVKRLPATLSPGDDGRPTPTRARTVAILPVGYADGFRGGPQHPRRVLIKGLSAYVIPPVRINETQVDISDIPDVRIGDEVVLIGRQGSETLSADEIAEILGTRNLEVLSQISSRIPRHKGS